MGKVWRSTGTPVYEPDGDGFLLSVPSGDEEILFSISRHNLRAFVEKTIRMLNAADREQAGVLLRIPTMPPTYSDLIAPTIPI